MAPTQKQAGTISSQQHLDRLTKGTADVQQIVSWLRVLLEPGSVVELRILGWQQREDYVRDRSGYYDYDHLQHLAAEALKYTGQSEGVYWTLNPVDPALLARAANKTKVASQKGKATGDQHVLRRRWLLVDCDPQRPAGISSTDTEKALAHQTILAIRDYLREDAGWPAPILADSGNGYHLLYRIDLPADDGDVVQRCLQALAPRFDTDQVKVDQTCFNPSRICKLYGTLAGRETAPRIGRTAGRTCWRSLSPWRWCGPSCFGNWQPRPWSRSQSDPRPRPAAPGPALVNTRGWTLPGG